MQSHKHFKDILQTLLKLCILIFAIENGYPASLQYSTNPYSFPIPQPVFGPNFFMADINDDEEFDYIFRSETKIYAYDHDGITQLWAISAPYPGVHNLLNHGSKCGAADVDHDTQTEVVFLIAGDSLIVVNGTTGVIKKQYKLTTLLSDQYACHMAIVQLNQTPQLEVIVQTADFSHECHTPGCDGVSYYINRSLLAINLSNGNILWQLDQDDNTSVDIYEGYWGQGHGPFFACDIDADGMDEIVGGNLVESDGTVTDLSYPQNWIDVNTEQMYIDHLDGISIGDIRPDIPGIEWVVTEENGNKYKNYNTTLISSTQGIIWSKYFDLFPDWASKASEPQHTAIGDFDLSMNHGETWVRSRLPIDGFDENGYESQRPWIFDAQGNLVNNYKTMNTLPPGFNTSPALGNKNGIENIWTIDWTGARKEYIAASARYAEGAIGIFNPMTGDSIWTSMNRTPQLQCKMLYVADISGDIREEMIVYDTYDQTIKVFWNSSVNNNPPKPSKWDDPLYTRLKQNWNFYSSGSYTYTGYPEITNVQITGITPVGATIQWDTDNSSNSQILFGETEALGSATSIVSSMVTQHAVTMNGLSLNTDYHIRIRSMDENGKIAFSKDTLLELIRLDPVQLTQIQKENPTYAKLTWTPAAGITTYNIYRGSNPIFDADTVAGSNRIAQEVQDLNPGTSDIEWIDSSYAIGDPANQYYYRVTSLIVGYESEQSNVLGEYDFKLNATHSHDSTNLNTITLPIASPGITNASQLANLIPNCNSIARWEVNNQAFEQYIPGCCGTNFTIQTGGVYYVTVSKDGVWSTYGDIAETQYNLLFNPSNTSYNDILLPLKRSDLGMASDLAYDIKYCNSVVQWNANSQGYDQYIPGNSHTDFTITPGQAYSVHMTANTSWPGGGSPKNVESRKKENSVQIKSHAPHAVWGWLHNQTNTRIINDFRAYMCSTPGDELTKASAGCRLHKDYWMVQCASFQNSWTNGDLIHIDFLDHRKNVLFQVNSELTLEPADLVQTYTSVENSQVPLQFNMAQNYPNPFNGTTVISFEIAEKTDINISILNTLGQKIKILTHQEHMPGSYKMIWDGLDRHQNEAPAGIYFVSFNSKPYKHVIRILYLK